MANTIIQALQDYFSACPLIVENGLSLNTNWLEPDAQSFGIFPLPGDKQIQRYPAKGGIYEYPFALQVNASNLDEITRLETQGFFENFGKWVEAQDEAENYPVLSTGETVMFLEVLSQGYLIDQGDSNVSTYEVPLRMTYERV